MQTPSHNEIRFVFEDILDAVKKQGVLNGAAINRILGRHNKAYGSSQRHFAKKHLAPFYLSVKESNPSLWRTWNIDETTERNLLATIQVKPRRTASGVATITVITKPHPCAGSCIYCPNDVRMPKSYLHEEPACQRAERNFFDPFLQVASRLAALERMGHATDKIELIVLGGSFTDYPSAYQIWFIRELFLALNSADDGLVEIGDVFARRAETKGNFTQITGQELLSPIAQIVAKRAALYENAGIENLDTSAQQQQVNAGQITYNEAVERLYGTASPWDCIAREQTATLEELQRAQAANEHAAHRVVGLVVETRPDAINPEALTLLRRLGCTKLQMGVQTLNETVAAACKRPTSPERIRSAFETARAFGFKSHAHFMANLPGATVESDRDDYQNFITDKAIAPDEVKLYPCVLIGGTRLEALWHAQKWQPYPESDLVELLSQDVLNTPEHTRISRMIRDFSSNDIVAGNKKTNLRQMVEQRVLTLAQEGKATVHEIRMREIATDATTSEELSLREEWYQTTNTTEVFLQWVTSTNRIAGFLRLSLPHPEWIALNSTTLPINPGEAMIREVHIYGAAARLHSATTGAQHRGLGKALVERACAIAREKGYGAINVISAVGTRNYYRNLGFSDGKLYLQRNLG